MSKSFHNAKADRECTEQCSSKQHINQAISAITKRIVTDKELAAYLYGLCFNIGTNRNEFGNSALHTAVSCGRSKLTLWLITVAKANINLKDYESGYTPLHKSLFYGHIDIAINLMKLGADLSIKDNEDLNALEIVTLDRSPLVDISLNSPCQVYVWGSNNNYTIGTGTDNARKYPEFLNQFKKNNYSIVQVEMDELHSVFVSRCGRVWTCGHGQGGRLGTGNEKPALTPLPIRTYGEKCVKAALALNHTLLLLENGTVLSFGSNQYYQLGVVPYVETLLNPRSVSLDIFKCKVEGICAGKYHSVFYNKNLLLTCGLNGGQLGHPNASNFQIIKTPTPVSLKLQEGNISHVASSNAAIVIVTTKGDIFTLHQFQCRKIASKQLNVKKVCVVGGTLESKGLSESLDLKVCILTSTGSILLWEKCVQQLTRCVFSLRRFINITDMCLLDNQIFFTTKEGEAFQGLIHKMNTQPASKGVTENSKSGTENKIFHTFLERSKCYNVEITKLPNIHRATAISCDPRGKNFAAIQVHPSVGVITIPVISQSEITQQLSDLFKEASDLDPLHDIVFKVSNRCIAAHRYIVCVNCPTLYDLVKMGGEIVIKNVEPYIFEQFLIYLYTGCCEIIQDNKHNLSVAGLKYDPVKLMLELACKYNHTFLINKLKCLKYENGLILLKDNITLEQPKIDSGKRLERTLYPEWYDIKLGSEDGITIEAHKCVLAARLHYFQSMFMCGWLETGSSKILKMPFPFNILKDVIDFLYTDQPPESLSSDDFDYNIRLLIASDQLLIKKLKEACEISLASSLTLKNAATLLQLSFSYNAQQLKISAMEFITLNMNAILESRSLEALDENALKELSIYYRNNVPKMQCRIITPFSDAPSDEEFNQSTEIPWIDNIEEAYIDTNVNNLKKQKRSANKKKITKKSSNLIAIDKENKPIQPIDVDSNISQPTTPIDNILTPPCSPENNDEVSNLSEFPSLGGAYLKKSSPFKLSSGMRRVPLPKISQKQRKKSMNEDDELSSSPSSKPPTPKFKGWAVISPPVDIPVVTNMGSEKIQSWSLENKFTDVVASDKEEKHNWTKMKTKSFKLTQLEDKAIEELKDFYNVSNIFDERIQIERVLPTNIAKPTWITSHKQLEYKGQ